MFYPICLVLRNAVLFLFTFLGSGLAHSEMIDFETVMQTTETPYKELRDRTIVHEKYEVYVWEGIFLDDSFLSAQWNTYQPDNSFHPSKGTNPGSSNTALITQRFKISQTDGQPFRICHVNVAEKRNNTNVADIEIISEYRDINSASYFVQTPIKIDKQPGYEQIPLDALNLVYSVDVIVRDANNAIGQLMFDDIKVLSRFEKCSN